MVPVGEVPTNGIGGIAGERIRAIFQKYDPDAAVEILSENRVLVKVAKHLIPSVIGRRGSNISDLERRLSISIDVEERDGDGAPVGEPVPVSISESKNALLLDVGEEYASMNAAVYVGEAFLTSRRVGRRGQIKLPKRSEAARRLSEMAASEDDVRVAIRDSQIPQ